MKKIMVALMCVMGGMMVSFGDNAINVYDFVMNLKTPTLYNGVRKVATQKYKGYLYAEYVDGEFTTAWATVVSSKTKVAHSINFTEGFYDGEDFFPQHEASFYGSWKISFNKKLSTVAR